MSKKKILKSTIHTRIRFSEVDAMGVVWHGNYVKYLEDGREQFGIDHKLGYYDVFGYGLMTPIVKLDIDYKRMIRYNESIIIEIEYVPTSAAKILFNYKIFNADTKEVVLTAKSIQVFINKEGELQLINPDFYTKWQKEWGLI